MCDRPYDWDDTIFNKWDAFCFVKNLPETNLLAGEVEDADYHRGALLVSELIAAGKLEIIVRDPIRAIPDEAERVIRDQINFQAVLKDGIDVWPEDPPKYSEFATERSCHAVALLHWLYEPTVEIWTGVSDNCFTHSWIMKDGEILETTPVPRDMYHGVKLVDVKSFARLGKSYVTELAEEHLRFNPVAKDSVLARLELVTA